MTDAESLAAAAADECRRILAEKDRLLEQARDERDAARDRADAAERERDEWSERHRQQRAAIVAAQDARAAAERALSEAREALRVALAAMQANIAYATRKDEYALARGIDACRAALPVPVPPGETTRDRVRDEIDAEIAKAWAVPLPHNLVDHGGPRTCSRCGPTCDVLKLRAAPAAHPETTPKGIDRE